MVQLDLLTGYRERLLLKARVFGVLPSFVFLFLWYICRLHPAN